MLPSPNFKTQSWVSQGKGTVIPIHAQLYRGGGGGGGVICLSLNSTHSPRGDSSFQTPVDQGCVNVISLNKNQPDKCKEFSIADPLLSHAESFGQRHKKYNKSVTTGNQGVSASSSLRVKREPRSGKDQVFAGCDVKIKRV